MHFAIIQDLLGVLGVEWYRKNDSTNRAVEFLGKRVSTLEGCMRTVGGTNYSDAYD